MRKLRVEGVLDDRTLILSMPLHRWYHGGARSAYDRPRVEYNSEDEPVPFSSISSEWVALAVFASISAKLLNSSRTAKANSRISIARFPPVELRWED